MFILSKRSLFSFQHNDPGKSHNKDSTCLVGNAPTALKITARGHGNGGCNGRRGTGLQAVASADELRKSLQQVNPELDKPTLKAQRVQRCTSSLKGKNKQNLKSVNLRQKQIPH